MEQIFTPLPPVPDHPRLEEEILQWWEDEQVFQQLREQNRGGPKFRFMDGPITANAPAGVHHGLGRTLKDVFQRYKALRGHDQRYQNGFDCQGLWIEVGVEHDLGLNSKRDIEAFGLEEFARRCREVVVRSSRELTKASKRLGQWMDWGNDYFTFSDTNIAYVWRMLKVVHERGYLYMGHRSTEWCPRCGTSLSQHELTQSGVYQDRADPSLFVRFPLIDREVYPEAEFPVGQWDYQLFYEQDFDKARSDFEANVANTVKALFRKGNPAGRHKPSRSAFVRSQGGWFGAAAQAPDRPLDTDVMTESEFRAYVAALERTGFFGPNAWYMNHARNVAFAAQSANNGRIDLPVLFLHGLYDYTCETVDSRLAEPMRTDCTDLVEVVVPSGHWMAQEKPIEVNAALACWLATHFADLWPGTSFAAFTAADRALAQL